jgi:hypothetical protein
MNEELLLAAMRLFDTPEKWNAFCELMNKNGEIQNRWWRKLQTEVYQRESGKQNLDWDIMIWGNWDIKWFIRGSELISNQYRSLVIHFWCDGFRVYYGGLDIDKVNELLENPKFGIIKSCFDNIEGSDSEKIGWEYRNFSFGSVFDGKFPDARSLSWYAGNETEKFADQLIQKVKKFQTQEITALFKEINEKCKRD